MGIKNRVQKRALCPLLSARSALLALALSPLSVPTAQAVQFTLGEFEGRFDSNLSLGSSWRVEDRDSDLISVPNGGTSKGSGSYDDGDLNFAQGDTFSRTFKGVHELALSRDNVGLFMR